MPRATSRLIFLCLAVLALSIFGCEGDDGTQGAQGPPGPPGEDLTRTVSESCVLCHEPNDIADVAVGHGIGVTEASYTINIASVTIPNPGTTGGPPTVNFTVTDQDGLGVAGLTLSNFRFTVAKLLPGASPGDATRWQNYINEVETKDAGEPGTTPDGTTAVQASRENNGTLLANGTGGYSYTYATDLSNVTTPIAVPYQVVTHRVGLELRGDIPRDDATFTFVVGGATRDIAAIVSCNECHEKLAVHGDGRFDTLYCVTCHNPGPASDPNLDANSGNTIDFKVMIHKIHHGEELPSVQAGTDYIIWGSGNSEHNFSDVVFPAGPSIPEIRHCTKCHEVGDAANSDNWRSVPTREACGSCHDNVNFDTGLNHGGGVQPNNSGCAACHPPSGVGIGKSVETAHEIPAVLASANFEYIINGIANTGPGEFPVVTFKVNDPVTSTPYDILNDDAFTGSGTRLAVVIGWDTTDYSNTGGTATPAQPVSINPLSADSPAVDNGDGSFTVTSSVAIPADAVGTGVVIIEGHPAADFDGDTVFSDRVPVLNVFEYFTITDAAPVERRTVVDIAKCDQCHIVLSLHGNNRTDEPKVCVVCHNANATDVNRRPADPATTPDSKAEEAIDFKYMVHAIHAASVSSEGAEGFRQSGLVIYGFGGSPTEFGHVRYPGKLRNCLTCHDAGAFELPLGATVKATTVDTGADKASPADDLNITRTTAVCSSCHDNTLSTGHMEQNGGAFDAKESEIIN